MARARFHLAQAYQRRGRKAEAVAQCQQFLELSKHADADLPELAEARGAISAGRGPYAVGR
jgi:cytochrome c-type biogenesis protein CcmH/NrfG